MTDVLTAFYTKYLPDAVSKKNLLQAQCPICRHKGIQPAGRITVYLNTEHFFNGYFTCSNQLCDNGFPLYFAKLVGISFSEVPGYDPDASLLSEKNPTYPAKNINQDITDYSEKLADSPIQQLLEINITRETLQKLHVGYNGRYITFPYMLADHNYYTARCIHPDHQKDSFWYGNEEIAQQKFHIFNRSEIDKCENGTLILTENEINLVILKEFFLPAIALPEASELEHLPVTLFDRIPLPLILWVNNLPDSLSAARDFATRTGFKARLIQWTPNTPQGASLQTIAKEKKEKTKEFVFTLLKDAKSFSPFSSPRKEAHFIRQYLINTDNSAQRIHKTGFDALDQRIGSGKGINIMGGTPKAGKSSFFLQIASETARQRTPVIYYDFENGRQKLYERILCRTGRLTLNTLRSLPEKEEQQKKILKTAEELQTYLRWFRIVNDRKLTPELMRRHIDFIQHETNTEYTTVIIDSLHKLPFKSLTERRSGIDGWLREMEAIRDEQNVAFWVISELTRGEDGQFEKIPKLGSFKGSGDIAYSADNALVFLPDWDPFDNIPPERRINDLWLVASREQAPGKIASYRLDYPHWGFVEMQ